MKSVLFVSGHPDDHMTAVGFLNKLRKKEYGLFEVVLTGGSGCYTSAHEKDIIVKTREEEYDKASKLLGMEKTYYLGYNEHGLIMNKENVENLIKIIREVDPEIIFIPNRDDYHETHIESNRISTKAIKTAMRKKKLELGEPSQHPLMVLEWGHPIPNHPEVRVDIRDEWAFKEEVMKIYISQIDEHEAQKIKSLNQYRGSAIEAEHAKAFKVNRFLPIRIDKLLGLVE